MFEFVRQYQQVFGLLENDDGRAKAVGKVGRGGDGIAGTPVQDYGRGAGDGLMAAIKSVEWIQSFSDILRAVQTPKVIGCWRWECLAALSHG